MFPDGNWLAYRSNQSGEHEVYLQPYPGPGPTVPVSIDGGRALVWSIDGSELFYRNDEGAVMAVEVDTTGDVARIGTRTELFRGGYIQPGGGATTRQYHVAPDGRFLMQRSGDVQTTETETLAQVVLVQNWFQELERLVPTN